MDDQQYEILSSNSSLHWFCKECDGKAVKAVKVDNDIIEVESVIDSEGNEYFEVDSLTQECVFVPITNPNYGKNNDFTRNLLRKRRSG